jgi:hypothetical protein
LLAPVGLVCLIPLLAIALPTWTTKVLVRLLPERQTVGVRVVGRTTLRLRKPFELPGWLDDALREFRIEYESPSFEQSLEALGPGSLRYILEDHLIDFVGVTSTPQSSSSGQQLTLANAPLDDLDADGVPDLLVVSYSGGAHCCWTYTVLRLGDEPAETLHLDAANGASFTRSGDATIIETIDSVWDYWNACFACSFKPTVVLRFSRGVLTLAPDLTLRPLPGSEDLAASEAGMRESLLQKRSATLGNDPVVPEPEYWRVPLELLYWGHEAEALALLRRAWPTEIPGREAFIADFVKNYETSPWSAQLRRVGGP